ncbi:hypothetical protein ACEN2A_01905 [Corynebacterium auriscanis]|uniref:hypothetical protein n=1 Tax=Corynebacterium auriscanis TaxID=99807 RepID=UPI003CEBAEFC
MDDDGGGPYDPETGLRDWYLPPSNNTPVQAESEPIEVKWVDILTHWLPAQLDLHERFGVDTESGILADRTWWWLHDRILDLLNSPSRLKTALGLPADYQTTL